MILKKNISFLIAAFILMASMPTMAQENEGESMTKNMPIVDSLTKPAIADSLESSKPAKHQIIAYYFHGTRRCPSCLKIEAYTKEAIDSGFTTELKDSLLIWNVVNTDEDSGKHFLEDYQLYTKSVILVDMHDNKQAHWKNLEKVWELLGDKELFKKYIREEITAYLKVD
jgi:hypothetical protein